MGISVKRGHKAAVRIISHLIFLLTPLFIWWQGQDLFGWSPWLLYFLQVGLWSPFVVIYAVKDYFSFPAGVAYYEFHEWREIPMEFLFPHVELVLGKLGEDLFPS